MIHIVMQLFSINETSNAFSRVDAMLIVTSSMYDKFLLTSNYLVINELSRRLILELINTSQRSLRNRCNEFCRIRRKHLDRSLNNKLRFLDCLLFSSFFDDDER